MPTHRDERFHPFKNNSEHQYRSHGRHTKHRRREGSQSFNRNRNNENWDFDTSLNSFEIKLNSPQEKLSLNEYFYHLYNNKTLSLEETNNCSHKYYYLPIPQFEVLREQHVRSVRSLYDQLCKTHLFIDSPKESFNRYLSERGLHEKVAHSNEPLIPCIVEPKIGPSMKHEILEDLPIKTRIPRNLNEARNNVRNYANNTLRIIEEYYRCINLLNENENDNIEDSIEISISKFSNDLIEQCKKTAEESLEWLDTEAPQPLNDNNQSIRSNFKPPLNDSHSNPEIETVQSYIKDVLEPKCGEIIRKIMTPRIDALCIHITKTLDEHQKQMQQQKEYLWHQIGLNTDKQELIEPPELNDIQPCDYIPKAVASSFDRFRMLIRIPEFDSMGDHLSFRINKMHYNKLQILHQRHHRRVESKESYNRNDHFNTRLWCLCQRYKTMFGMGRFEGSGFHAAVPSQAFRMLTREYGVAFECFASPFNCHFSHYCSMFQDLDAAFGSAGSFQSFHPVQGSFEANPPFTEEVMIAMAERIDWLLEQKDAGPLSFIVFVPDWMDPPSKAIIAMSRSPFCRGEFILEPQQHQYTNGMQHTERTDRLLFTAVHGTRVFVLQNDKGAEKWPHSKLKEYQLGEAMRNPY
eukprot:gb/GECH01004551.1/.p1 GENE.gb/GECH01004551.1/~~gb/GECH01004551.1/.p1  ORF type:complete len:634 (+),score=170.70 gb/GECH01004551.1/:1-1902(+)